MPLKNQVALFVASFVIVAFGQPAWIWWLGLLAACVGYALFWRVLLCYPELKKRFWLGTAWMMGVVFVQLSWLLSHPYAYIYGVYVGVALLVGMQFGLLCLLITKERCRKISQILAVAALWTLMEWARLFFFSGYSWNPAGMALSGSLVTLQMAALAGIFGLTFWVFLVNLLALRAWVYRFSASCMLVWILAATAPYLFGSIHLSMHTPHFDKEHPPFRTVMVQTAFPAEEAMVFSDAKSFIAYVTEEWRQILRITQKHHPDPIDLIVLPEFVVPLGTYSFMFPHDEVHEAFHTLFGKEVHEHLPTLEEPLARKIDEEKWLVSNAYWAQALANVFRAGVVAGLEDAEDFPSGEREFYSAAIYFRPNKSSSDYMPNRYEKRVLVPMGEYIPFDFAKKLAASYGVTSSFTPGQEARVFHANECPFGLSICYEETFSDITRESREKGAQMLVNLTSDVWYPNSRLPQQHFDHARLRTVETGVPLVRACNTGITGAVDSLGRVVALLGDGDPKAEWVSDSIKVEVPRYHYSTLYTYVGDSLIIGICLLLTVLFFRTGRL